MPAAVISFDAQVFSVAHGNHRTIVRGADQQTMAIFGPTGCAIQEKSARKEPWNPSASDAPVIDDGFWETQVFNSWAPPVGTTPKVFAHGVDDRIQLWIDSQPTGVSFYFGWGGMACGFDERSQTGGTFRWGPDCDQVPTGLNFFDVGI